ncbi:MAG: hypothetical protein ACXVBX_16685 [Flavisolibacter sp.]
MRTDLLFIVCLCIAQTLYCQQTEPQKNVVSEKYAVTLVPAFFPYDKMGLQPGFQFRISDHFALMNEVAFPIVISPKHEVGIYNETQFLRASTELKFFRAKSPHGRFTSFQLGYGKRHFVDKDSGWYHNEGDTVLTGYSSLSISSPVFFCDLKMGGEMFQWKKVFMDFFIGVGLRVIPTKYDVEGAYPRGIWTPPKEFLLFGPDPAWEYNKTIIKPHFSLGFRIGRKF